MNVSDAKPKGSPVEIYCDESLDRGGYDVLGGLWLSRPQARRLRSKIRALRERCGYDREFKWQKATGSRLSPVYMAYGEMLMDHILGTKSGGFHCIVIPKRFMDYRSHHLGDPELAFYKFWHLLFRKRVRPGASYIVHMDQRSNQRATRLTDLRDVLNNCGRKDHGLLYDCCRDVIPRDSKTEELVQAADILVGAVGYHYAKGHLAAKASPAKCELAERLARKLGRDSLAFQTPKSEERFNIWLWRPRLG